MTVQDVFDIAITEMDAQNENTGSTDTSDTKEYKVKVVRIINGVLDQLLPYSDTYTPVAGKSPCCTKVTALADTIELSDALCYSVLPFYVAKELCIEESPDKTNYFNQMYERNLAGVIAHTGTEDEDIVNLYGGTEYGADCEW